MKKTILILEAKLFFDASINLRVIKKLLKVSNSYSNHFYFIKCRNNQMILIKLSMIEVKALLRINRKF